MLNRKIARLKRDLPPFKDIRCILHGIQVTKNTVIRNTQNGVPRYGVSNESSLALLRGILFELQSNAVDLREALAEVRNYREFSIIFFLNKKSARTTVACVYMEYKRLMKPGKMQSGSRG